MSTIWVNKPKRLYIIETDQKTFKVERDYLNYKTAVSNLKAAGYTNIHINCLGKALHINY